MKLSQLGEIVLDSWNDLPNYNHGIEFDEFVIKPNHIRGIIIINDADVGAIHESPLHMTQYQRRKMKISIIIGRYTMITAKEINLLRIKRGISVWQRSFYDHIIRNNKEINTIRDYIQNNILKWAFMNGNQDDIPLQQWIVSGFYRS